MSVTDIIAELSRTAELAAKVPDLERTTADLTHKVEQEQRHNQGLEENITSYKRQIEELTNKVRSLEVERDDYGFRQMQAEDTVEKLRKVLGNLTNEVGDALRASEKPKPEGAATANNEPAPSVPNEPQASVHGDGTTSSEPQIRTEPKAIDPWPAPTADPSPPLPYAGMKYSDRPFNVSWDDFVAGGGQKPYWMT